MTFDVEAHTIYYVRHGSHAYGLNVETSDEDFKGVCLPPLRYQLGFRHEFEQHTEEVCKGAAHDSVVYSLKKFIKLAAGCNPSIIETLFCDERDVIKQTTEGSALRLCRKLFLSRQAYNAFSGYAFSQLEKVVKRGLADERARKSAMHLIRLSRMCVEILSDGKVNVRRIDRSELLGIRAGARSVESLVKEATELHEQAKASLPTSPLPEHPDYDRLDRLVVDLSKNFYGIKWVTK